MVADISKNWFVLCTKPRNELKVCERLTSIGIQGYTPCKTEVRQWSDRTKKVLVPLLPSMVLVSLKDKQVDQVFEVPGVVRYLFEHGKRAKVSNQEVLAMQRYLENTYQRTPKELEVGDTVKVPLLEQEATLLSIKGKKCLAQLQKLGAIVSFQLQ
ncbi:MAG: transcription termination/antitermination NusG family protein [Polaribacter sp.]|jgi:transcriptional antiterminator RfaH|nr:transcription termination/antitermination NusG family protein [Polaribacter sp.]